MPPWVGCTSIEHRWFKRKSVVIDHLEKRKKRPSDVVPSLCQPFQEAKEEMLGTCPLAWRPDMHQWTFMSRLVVIFYSIIMLSILTEMVAIFEHCCENTEEVCLWHLWANSNSFIHTIRSAPNRAQVHA